MASFLCDLHIWSLKDDLLVRDTDFSCLKFFDKNQSKVQMVDRPYAQDKMTYIVGRGDSWYLENKRSNNKLKSSLRELEDLLSEQSVVFSKWRHPGFFQMMLSSGLIVNIFLSKVGGLDKITFDKILVGRLLDYIMDVDFTSRLIVVTYLESRVTVVSFGKPLVFSAYESLAQFDPRLHLFELLGPAGRRLTRHVVLSPDSNLALFWWSSNVQEVFPWAPHLKEEDRANIMLFSFKNPSEPRRIGYIRTHSDPISIRFSPDASCLHYLGQEETRRGETLLENAILCPQGADGQMKRKGARKLSIPSQITCKATNDNLVVLGCIDGTLLLLDALHHRLHCQSRAAFIPSVLRIHPDGAILIAANERGLVQAFDVALNPAKLNFSHDDASSSGNVLDLSQYFRQQMTLCDASWSCSERLTQRMTQPPKGFTPSMAQNYLLIRMHSGPLLLLRLSGGCLTSGSLGPLQITAQYLKHGLYQQVLLLLYQQDWASNGETILMGLSATMNKLFRVPFCKEIETLMEMCLGLFYSPAKPVPEEILDEYSEQIRDVTRKFFHHLLRHNQMSKAFQLAVDINDYDLFMDLYYSASRAGLTDLAGAAIIKAKYVYSSEQADTSSSTGPNSSGASEQPRDDKPNGRSFALPSPMQLFSAVAQSTPVQPEESQRPQLTTSFATSAVTSFASSGAKRNPDFQPSDDILDRAPLESLRYTSIVTLPTVQTEEKDDNIQVINFGIV